MKTQPNTLTKLWRRIVKRARPAHDPFLSLSITRFNFSSGWDRVLQRQHQLGS